MENVKVALQSFLEYLQIERNYSKYTIVFYEKDIEEFFEFMKEEAIPQLFEVTHVEARLYLTKLHQKNTREEQLLERHQA